MPTEVLIPKLGMTMTEGTVAEWRVPEAAGLGVDFSPQFLKDHTVKL